jgi:hypothetical protein
MGSSKKGGAIYGRAPSSVNEEQPGWYFRSVTRTCLFALLLLASAPAPASWLDGTTFQARTGLYFPPVSGGSPGPLAGLSAELDVLRRSSVGVFGEYSAHSVTSPIGPVWGELMSGGLYGKYVFDLLPVEPYLQGSLFLQRYARRAYATLLDPAAAMGVGLDWKLTQHWVLSVEVRYGYSLTTTRFPFGQLVMVGFGWRTPR